jgi:hypothetical protein
MAITGPVPKDGEKRQRRNEPTFPPVELDERGDPAKAPKLPNARRYLAATKAWYATWASSPQASQFTGTDWLRLHMLAELVDGYFRADDPGLQQKLMGEIRLNEAKLGATPEDRLRLRWHFAMSKDAGERGEQAAASTRKPSRRRGDPRLKLVEEKTP